MTRTSAPLAFAGAFVRSKQPESPVFAAGQQGVRMRAGLGRYDARARLFELPVSLTYRLVDRRLICFDQPAEAIVLHLEHGDSEPPSLLKLSDPTEIPIPSDAPNFVESRAEYGQRNVFHVGYLSFILHLAVPKASASTPRFLRASFLERISNVLVINPLEGTIESYLDGEPDVA